MYAFSLDNNELDLQSWDDDSGSGYLSQFILNAGDYNNKTAYILILSYNTSNGSPSDTLTIRATSTNTNSNNNSSNILVNTPIKRINQYEYFLHTNEEVYLPVVIGYDFLKNIYDKILIKDNTKDIVLKAYRYSSPQGNIPPSLTLKFNLNDINFIKGLSMRSLKIKFNNTDKNSYQKGFFQLNLSNNLTMNFFHYEI